MDRHIRPWLQMGAAGLLALLIAWTSGASAIEPTTTPTVPRPTSEDPKISEEAARGPRQIETDLRRRIREQFGCSGDNFVTKEEATLEEQVLYLEQRLEALQWTLAKEMMSATLGVEANAIARRAARNQAPIARGFAERLAAYYLVIYFASECVMGRESTVDGFRSYLNQNLSREPDVEARRIIKEIMPSGRGGGGQPWPNNSGVYTVHVSGDTGRGGTSHRTVLLVLNYTFAPQPSGHNSRTNQR